MSPDAAFVVFVAVDVVVVVLVMVWLMTNNRDLTAVAAEETASFTIAHRTNRRSVLASRQFP